MLNHRKMHVNMSDYRVFYVSGHGLVVRILQMYFMFDSENIIDLLLSVY